MSAMAQKERNDDDDFILIQSPNKGNTFAFAFNFFLYIAINLGMVTGLLPVVGVPLPILSYGGTAMLTNMIGFGIVLSAKLYNEDFI